MTIINSGSGPAPAEAVNDFFVALGEAQRWLKRIHEDGWPEVQLIEPPRHAVRDDGTWRFVFVHPVTGKTCTLDQHGFTQTEMDRCRMIFGKRVYWNGCSSSNPKPDDWAADGHRWRYVYEEL